MILITNNGYVARFDQEDAEVLSHYSWYGISKGGGRYIVASDPSDYKRMVYMHRVILETGGGIDHINGDGCDNRRENLRPATQSQNGANARPRVGGTSRYKGVSWHSQAKKWWARITHGRKTKSLGFFSDEREAALAYDRAARDTFGEFARVNLDMSC